MKRVTRNIPQEIVDEILLRLPPKSLMRFKCVCKSWNARISDPSFVDKHLDYSKKSSASSLFLCWTSLEKHYKRTQIHYEDPDKALALVSFDIYKDDSNSDRVIPCVIEKINLPTSLLIFGDGLVVEYVGSHCNGIICLYGTFGSLDDAILLCNPSLREYKLIGTPGLHSDFTFSGCGFGFDASANDYKFVKLFSSGDHDALARASVYTLGTDSWKEIKIELKGILGWNIRDEGLCCKGVCYWLIEYVPNSNDAILSFDMSEEVFSIVALPDHMQKEDRNAPKTIMLWNDSIVVLFYRVNSASCPTSLEIWVMVDNPGGAERFTSNWRQHLEIELREDISFCKPLTFWNDDELLFARRRCILSFNLYTQKLTKIPIYGETLGIGCDFADVYLNSLVSVGEGIRF